MARMPSTFEEMQAWANQQVAARNAALNANKPSPKETPDPETNTAGDPTDELDPIAERVARYYRNALAGDPRMAAVTRNMRGVVSPDVRNSLAQAAAERGVGIGSYGGGADTSGLLRSLGLTSMDLTNRGIQQYGEMYEGVPDLDPESLFITPSQQAEMDLRREELNRRIAAEAANLRARLQAEADAQNRTLSQDRDFFNMSRTDTLGGAASTNAALSGILNRLTGQPGGTGGTPGAGYGDGEGVYGGSGTGGPTGWFGANPDTTVRGGGDWNEWVGGLPDSPLLNYDGPMDSFGYNPLLDDYDTSFQTYSDTGPY